MEPKPDQTFSNAFRGAMAGAEWWRGEALSDGNAETENFEDLELVQVFSAEPPETRTITANQHERLIDIAFEVIHNSPKDYPMRLCIAIDQCDQAFCEWVDEQRQGLIDGAGRVSDILASQHRRLESCE